MKYMYKTLMKAENKTFDFYQQRWNSKKSYVVALDKTGRPFSFASFDNKTGEIFINFNNFKAATVNRLIELLRAERNSNLTIKQTK